MKAFRKLLLLLPMVALLMITSLRAEIEVRLSVKFILRTDGTRPSGGTIDISTQAGFGDEVDHGNQALALAARGYRLQVVEYLDIQPPVPTGQPSDYWFNRPARDERQTIETAALADTATWRWNANALNIYVNNSSSGSCSFIGAGRSIALGGTIFTEGTVVHEVGHFFNLRHTHGGDPVCPGAPPYPILDGDGLAETIRDHNCLNRDSLSQSNFNGRAFAALTPAEQAQVNSSWLNVMSYHLEEIFLPDQMDIWTTNANNPRLFACLGRTWFVAPGGLDGNLGTHPTVPFATVARGLSSVQIPQDVVLLRAGTYAVPAGNSITTRCTLAATRGPVTIVAP